MAEVFEYPAQFPGWFIEYFDFLAWCIAVVVLAGVWVMFFRYGKFSYGIDFGCLWKSTVIIILTTAVLGVKQVVTVRFLAEHGEDGNVVRIDDGTLSYTYRDGKSTIIGLEDIVRIYKEPVTFNPPPKFYVVADKAGKRDSVFVTENLPRYETLLKVLAERSNVPFER